MPKFTVLIKRTLTKRYSVKIEAPTWAQAQNEAEMISGKILDGEPEYATACYDTDSDCEIMEVYPAEEPDMNLSDSGPSFLQLGQRCRARVVVYDLPGTPDPGPIHALPGEEGVVVHTQAGSWPTVTFDRTGSSTCVTDQEVDPL